MLNSNPTTCVEFVSKHIRTNPYVDFMLAAVKLQSINIGV